MATQLFRIEKEFQSLKDWREAQRLSQAEAAEILGISQKAYSMLERGTRYAKGKLAKRMVEVTSVPLAVIVGAV